MTATIEPVPAASEPQREIESWGRFPKSHHTHLSNVAWDADLPKLNALNGSGKVLAYGYGRSYGDSCLNDGGTLLDLTGMRRFISFDQTTGVLRCEAGMMLADIAEWGVPRGWFLPVTPGTKFVSVGGAIANDVHGKNHHRDGTLGRHVLRFELLRSDGSRFVCTPTENSEFFRATIGGLGLTGLILWAEIQLAPIPGPYIAQQQIRFRSIDEFFELNQDTDERFQFTVSWVDCLAVGPSLGRGFMMLGNYDRLQPRPGHGPKPQSLLTVPIDAPAFLLNPLTVKLFNTAIYATQVQRVSTKLVDWNKFFYPLDSVNRWNKLYGKPGFLQYQFVVPFNDNFRALKAIMGQVAKSGEASFLVVLKTFGNLQSPGMLSFPREGVTMTLDFPFRGQKTLALLETLDGIVREAGGAVYPAKDARMSAASFQAFFPMWREFSQYVDPNFSSNFWRRVTGATALG